jgi:hypothetical protein
MEPHLREPSSVSRATPIDAEIVWQDRPAFVVGEHERVAIEPLLFTVLSGTRKSPFLVLAHLLRSGAEAALINDADATMVTGGVCSAVFRDGRFSLSNAFYDRLGLGKKIAAEHFTRVQVS